MKTLRMRYTISNFCDGFAIIPDDDGDAHLRQPPSPDPAKTPVLSCLKLAAKKSKGSSMFGPRIYAEILFWGAGVHPRG